MVEGQRSNPHSRSLTSQRRLGHVENPVAVWTRAGQQHGGDPGPGEDR